MRAGLPQGLADPDSKLRTAVGLAIAAIAAWDCPDAWPDLLQGLLQAINQRDNQPLGKLPTSLPHVFPACMRTCQA